MEIVLYGVFGILTTLVNMFVYWVCSGFGTVQATCIAWFVSVLFAFITNRLFVFKSDKAFLHECLLFYAGRLATGLLDVIIMYVFVDMFYINGMCVKIFSNIVVIILNYVVSKLFVFKRKDGNQEK